MESKKYIIFTSSNNNSKTHKAMTTQDNKAIAITLGMDSNYNFSSLSVWASDSVLIYSSNDFNSEESIFWLNKITIEDCKQYYSLHV